MQKWKKKKVKWWWRGRADREMVLKKIEYVTFFPLFLFTFCAANSFPTRLNWMSFTLFCYNSHFIISLTIYIHFYAMFSSFSTFRECQTSTMQFIGGADYTPLQSFCQKVFPCLTSDGTPFNFVCLRFLLMENMTCHPFLNGLS